MLTLFPLIAFMGLGPMEMMICGVLAVLLFGSRLPSVARSAGKSLTEFKKGMQDLQDDVRDSIEIKEPAGTTAHSTSSAATPVTTSSEDEEDTTSYTGYPEPEAPRFESSAVKVAEVPEEVVPETSATDKSTT